jgi:hypothetical protein
MSGSVGLVGSNLMVNASTLDGQSVSGFDGNTRMNSYLASMATAINDRFEQLMGLAMMMSSGIVTKELLAKLDDLGVTVDGIGLETYANNTANHSNVTENGTVNTSVVQIDPDVLMESPGTLFLLQQIMTKLKDAMAGLQAAGAQPGSVLTAAMQKFGQGLN